MPSRLVPLAKSLRRNATGAERRLWQGLRRKEVAGFRFRRQVPLGAFIADFASFEARLVIEVDGATHSTDVEVGRDAGRTRWLAAQGFAVLRFTDGEVFHNLDGVLETIRLKLIELRPRIEGDLSPLKRGEEPRASSPLVGED
jgi:very-short-patch-repair endonuclease